MGNPRKYFEDDGMKIRPLPPDEEQDITIAVEVFDNEPEFTLNEYLANYSRNRALDNVIKKWYLKNYPTTYYRTVEGWDEIFEIFRTSQS